MKKVLANWVCGRMLLCINYFPRDRQYSFIFNDNKSPKFTSGMGIPQGLVIIPVLCNVCYGDSMTDIEGEHAEFADDVSVCKSDKTIDRDCKNTTKDMAIEKKWCGHWNMAIAVDKTEVMIFTYDGRIRKGQMSVKY